MNWPINQGCDSSVSVFELYENSGCQILWLNFVASVLSKLSMRASNLWQEMQNKVMIRRLFFTNDTLEEDWIWVAVHKSRGRNLQIIYMSYPSWNCCHRMNNPKCLMTHHLESTVSLFVRAVCKLIIKKYHSAKMAYDISVLVKL